MWPRVLAFPGPQHNSELQRDPSSSSRKCNLGSSWVTDPAESVNAFVTGVCLSLCKSWKLLPSAGLCLGLQCCVMPGFKSPLHVARTSLEEMPGNSVSHAVVVELPTFPPAFAASLLSTEVYLPAWKGSPVNVSADQSAATGTRAELPLVTWQRCIGAMRR